MVQCPKPSSTVILCRTRAFCSCSQGNRESGHLLSRTTPCHCGGTALKCLLLFEQHVLMPCSSHCEGSRHWTIQGFCVSDLPEGVSSPVRCLCYGCVVSYRSIHGRPACVCCSAALDVGSIEVEGRAASVSHDTSCAFPDATHDVLSSSCVSLHNA